MHDYDIALKLTLQGAAGLALRALTGVHIERWLNVELPEVRNATSAKPGGSARRRYRVFPSQILLYVGEEPLRMDAELSGPSCRSDTG